MSFSVDAGEYRHRIAAWIGHQDRFQRLITTLRQVLSAMRLRCYVT